MVRITNADYHAAYEYIKQDSVEGTCLIFVSADVDSLCAVLMFQQLLKSDIIQHNIVPISGMQDLKDANEKLVSVDENLRSIVLFNCGGIEQIEEVFTATPDTKFYIIDSHRPLLLHNLTTANNYVCVFDDESENDRMIPLIEAFDRVESAQRDNSEDEESDQTDSDVDDYERPRQRRRLNEGVNKVERNELRRLKLMMNDYYGGGTSLSGSVSGIVYQLAQQLGKSSNELLWLAIVGVTSLYIFERMDNYKYGELLEQFKDERARLNLDRTEEGAVNTRHVDINAEDEYRFMLFRHWSLYDSMYHSGYVASKLGVWKDAGKKRLSNMFAKMGFSLTQCHQIYTHMNLDLKQMLRNKIEVVAPLYGLTDICFPSFTRNFGYECCLSASDVVYSISTILETSPTAAAKLGVSLNWNEKGSEWQTDMDKRVELMGERRGWWMRNFYTAYDALNSSSPDGLLRGIQLCMKTQEAIVRQGTSIIDKRLMKILNKFRYIRLDTGADLSIFYHPSSLTKLGLFLTDAYREHAKKNMPIVVASYDEFDKSYLVVALSGAPTFGETRKNTLGMTFMEAADKAKTRISFDSFDPAVIQVDEKDLVHYMETVRNLV